MQTSQDEQVLNRLTFNNLSDGCFLHLFIKLSDRLLQKFCTGSRSADVYTNQLCMFVMLTLQAESTQRHCRAQCVVPNNNIKLESCDQDSTL